MNSKQMAHYPKIHTTLNSKATQQIQWQPKIDQPKQPKSKRKTVLININLNFNLRKFTQNKTKNLILFYFSLFFAELEIYFRIFSARNLFLFLFFFVWNYLLLIYRKITLFTQMKNKGNAHTACTERISMENSHTYTHIDSCKYL